MKKNSFNITLRTDVRNIEMLYRFFREEDNFHPENYSQLLRYAISNFVQLIQHHYNIKPLDIEGAINELNTIGKRKPSKVLLKELSKENIRKMREGLNKGDVDVDEYLAAFQKAMEKGEKDEEM